MLVESLLWIVAGAYTPAHAHFVESVQLSPALAYTALGTTITAGIFWLLITFFLGRVYCSSICPLGTVQDIIIRARRLILGERRAVHFRYRKGTNRRFFFLGLYVAGFVAAIGCIPLLLGPWPSFYNAVNHLAGHGVPHEFAGFAVGAGLGMGCAVVSMLPVLIFAIFRGRDFCNEVCPIGTILQTASTRSLMHIELYPDRCTACLKCQDECKASCIDIKTRTIDNSRCIRCFNCVSVCEDNAIRFTANRNGIVTGLFMRRRELS